MPTYTDPATGRQINSGEPLTDAELEEAFGGGAPTPPAAAPSDPRMPLVTEALAGEGVPQPPGSVADLLAPTRAEGAARMSPEGFAKMDVAAPLFLPGGASFLGAGAIGGGYGGLAQTLERIRSKGITDLDATDYRAIGKTALEGAAVGMAMHGVANLIFGKPAPARREAEDALTLPGGPLGLPQRPPVPTTPAGQAALGQRVEDVIGPNIPQVTSPQVSDAYDAFKAANRGRPINVTTYNQTLAEYAGVHFPNERLPAPERLFDPVGTPVRTTLPGRATTTGWVATADELVASENGIAFAERQKNAAGEPNLPGGLMARLRGELKGDLRGALTQDESAALAEARATAAQFHQAENARELLDSARRVEPEAQGQLNPIALARKLTTHPDQYRRELGDALYEQMKTLADAGVTLSKQPGGREAFGQIVTRAAGGLAGYLGGTPYGTAPGIGGAAVGAVIGPRLLGPYTMRLIEGIARARGTAGAVPEAVGRLAVAFSMDEPAPAPPPAHSIDGLLTASGAP